MTKTFGSTEVEHDEKLTDEHRGVPYMIEHTNTPHATDGGSFEWVYRLKVNGITRATSRDIEELGYSEPWVAALEKYAKAWIEGRN
jgi:hypothetical protein